MKISNEEYKDLVISEDRYWKIHSFLTAITKEKAKYVVENGYGMTSALTISINLNELDRAFGMNLVQCATQMYMRALKEKEEQDGKRVNTEEEGRNNNLS